MTVTVYGIPNCDTVKKARTWLEARGIAYAFHDYKKQGADPERIAGWIVAEGLGVIVNKAGTTYRKLAPDDQAALADPVTAPGVLAAHPSVIKRPVVEYPGGILVGFKEPAWSAAFG